MCVPALPLLDDRKSIDHTRRRGRLGGVQRDRKPYSPFFRAPEPMPPLKRSDLDQAVRYLQHARELLEREPGARMRVIREVLRLAMRRLSPGDFYAGDATAEITLLRDIANKIIGEARTDVLKAVAILTDRSG